MDFKESIEEAITQLKEIDELELQQNQILAQMKELGLESRRIEDRIFRLECDSSKWSKEINAYIERKAKEGK